ncbi:hypothetical protein [Zooshikella harenae]|uniref:Uncharacterized protein n=1 Tax=Zooshikella harenae TaxID=2827238 RepID=A0ABS5ZD55_9GAMM|nr:hypothetical protein [Zooshikella harenae]MBU2711994.1 hypothetical protein [Zooshikella harenae]
MAQIVPWLQGADVGCYTDCGSENSRDHVLSIINYWRKLALFSGLELDQAFLQNESIQAITFDMLLSSNYKLPWLIKENVHKQSQCGYTLILLPYEKNYLFNKVSEVFSCSDTALDRLIRRERGMFDGINYYASCQLTGDGQLMSPTLQVSTQPWACGQLRSILVNEFHWEAFEKANQYALDELSTWYDPLGTTALDNTRLLSLVRLLQQWAGVAPTGKHVAYLIPQVQLPKLRSEYSFSSSNKRFSVAYNPQLANLTEIFNQLRKRYNHQPLLDYFGQTRTSPLNSALFEEKSGSKQHLDMLGEIVPCCARGLRKSTYFDDPALQPILERILTGKSKDNLYCISSVVNTDHSVLWQDMIADIVVRKAKVLSEFAHTRNTITHSRQVMFNGQTFSIAGFDKRILSNDVLATSNEHNSLDTKLHWLKQLVPGKITRTNTLGELEEFFGVAGISASELLTGAAELGYNIESVDCFKVAKINFLQKNTECQAFSHNIKKLFKLYEKIENESIPPQAENGFLNEKQAQYQSVLKTLQQLDQALEENITYKHWLKKQLESNEQQAPSYLSRIYNPKAWKDYRHQQDELRQQLDHSEQQIVALEKQKRLVQLRYEALAPEMSKVSIKLEAREQYKKQLKEDYLALFSMLMGHDEWECNAEELPQPITLQDKLLQQHNANQTELYLTALQVHVAWVNELVEQELVANNISLIQAIKRGFAGEIQTEIFTIAWQLLGIVNSVMVTPQDNVDSLVPYLKRGEIDWLLVSHGESFSPSVAASAIWCSRSIVLVGNPLEPTQMHSIPAELHHLIGLNTIGSDYSCWSPLNVSAYSVANRYSKETKDVMHTGNNDELCLSMPLQRVEYFLEELRGFWQESLPPWFQLQSINTPEKAKPFGNSMWIHLDDHFDEGRYFALQQKLVLQFVMAHFIEEQQLPDMCIVCQGQNEIQMLKKMITDPFIWRQWLPDQAINTSREMLDKWANQYICSLHNVHQCKAEFLITLIPINGLFEDWLQEYPNFLLSLVSQITQAAYFFGPHHLGEKNSRLGLLQQQLTMRKLPPAFYDEVLDEYVDDAMQMA